MDAKEAQAYAILIKSRTPAEIKAVSDELLADHDKIVRYDWLRDHIADLPKEERKRIYGLLNEELAKYPGRGYHEDPMFGKPLLALRAKIGLFRGVKWDRFGALRVAPEVREANIARLRSKLEEFLGPNPDLTKDYGPKVANILATIKEHQDVLDGKTKTYGSIWDFITSDVDSASKLTAIEGE